MPYIPVPYSDAETRRVMPYSGGTLEGFLNVHPYYRPIVAAHDAAEAKKAAEVAAKEAAEEEKKAAEEAQVVNRARAEAEARARAEAEVKHLTESLGIDRLPHESLAASAMRKAQDRYALNNISERFPNIQSTQPNQTLTRPGQSSYGSNYVIPHDPTTSQEIRISGSPGAINRSETAQDFLASRLYDPYNTSQNVIPPQSILELTGNELAKSAIGNYLPYLENSKEMLQNAARPYTPEDRENYMSASLGSMLKDNRDRAEEYYNNVILPSVEGRFTRLGQGIGHGAREQLSTLTAKHMRDLNASQNELQHKAHMSAYDMYMGDRNKAIESAKLISGLGAQNQLSALAEASQLQNHGASARGVENQRFQHNETEFRNKEEHPFRRATAVNTALQHPEQPRVINYRPATQSNVPHSQFWKQGATAFGLNALGNMIGNSLNGSG